MQNNSNYSALSYERYDIQGNKLDHMNLIRFHLQPKPVEKPVESVDIKEEEIYPQGQKDFNIDVKIPEDVIEIEPETKNISLWHVFLLLLVLVSTSAGGLIFLWRRRAKDPELERLKMSSFKSIKVYNPKNEKNIAMVDLVL